MFMLRILFFYLCSRTRIFIKFYSTYHNNLKILRHDWEMEFSFYPLLIWPNFPIIFYFSPINHSFFSTHNFHFHSTFHFSCFSIPFFVCTISFTIFCTFNCTINIYFDLNCTCNLLLLI